jgi:(p)ppGpp synthase/HD superfamily hydrolase
MNAEEFARQVHAADRYGDHPYSVHLEAVVAIVREADGSELAESVAWLHDVVEDSDLHTGDIEREFGRVVSVAVACVTDPNGPNRRTRKARLHAQLAKLDHEQHESYRIALLVKAADRLANVRASAADNPGKLKMYRREHASFEAAAHRPGLCDAIWDEIDGLLAE